MIRKAEYTEWVDNYLSNQLNIEQRLEFEAELKIDAALNEELNLQLGIQDALTEKDVLELRKSLSTITGSGGKQAEKIKASFDLLEDLDTFIESEEKVDPRELLNYYESLPKLHIYQHEIASKENVHHFYKEQEITNAEIDDDDFEFVSDDELMAEIKDAVMEKDVIQLRDNLKHISKSVPDHNFSNDQIEQYIEKTLPVDELEEFEKELKTNSKLAADVRLHKELGNALMEADVMNLRAQLGNIMESQTSYNQDFDDIENYIDHELTDEELAEFENDMYENSDLRADVILHREVNQAVGETDVMDLRAKLKDISKEIEIQEEKSIIRINPERRAVILRYSAVVALLVILGISALFRLNPMSSDELYSMFYEEYPKLGVSRSANTSETDLLINKGITMLSEQNYEGALAVFKQVAESGNDNAQVHFYAGEIYSNLKEYSNAINEYKVVIDNKENTLVELAEYNIGLCFIAKGEIELAEDQMNRIINKNGYYKSKAEATLEKLKYIKKEN